MKKNAIFFLIFSIAVLHCGTTIAQNKKPAAKPAAVTPAKPVVPKLRTFIANLQGGKVNMEGALTILDKPVVVKDEKGNDWQVVSIRFWWRSLDRFEDPETGEKKSTWNTLVKDIRSASLPASVIESVKYEIKPGDELYYETIMVQGKDGNKYLAPSMRFSVQ